MGDMKTPDFDDLLAAFDIPDATGLDAKEPVQDSHEETESQLKHTGICLDDSLLSNHSATAIDVPAVSVIVKNTGRQDSLENLSDRLHSEPVLQNGFRGQGASIDSDASTNTGFTKSFVSALNGECSTELQKAPIQHKLEGTPIFSQSFSHFSPVSSPESEDGQFSRDELHPKKDKPCVPEASDLMQTLISDNPQKHVLNTFDCCSEDSDVPNNANGCKADCTKSSGSPDISIQTDKAPGVHNVLPPPNDKHKFENDGNSETKIETSNSHTHVKSQACKLSSCLEALVALNTTKEQSEHSNPRESSAVQADCLKNSPKVPISPYSPRSPFEVVKRLMKPSDSPRSICSESSDKVSPAAASGSPSAIPRVRIKTIKTTSGQIRHTVTSVLPESETDEIRSICESSPSQSMISEDSSSNMSPHQSQNAVVEGISGIQSKGSPCSSSPPKMLHNKSEAYFRESGVGQSSTSFHSTSGLVKRAVVHQGQQSKRMSATTGHASSPNFLPKAMHLASLNLVPHSVAASVTARSTSHQQSQHTLSSTVYSTVPLVHQVKTTNTYPRPFIPNTAAGTLNRLLNSANPVPTYVPNLNPPSESNINLPPRGYCCLECGDSFGVERSLSSHYGRRSVHIEVGCTHCAKTIVFFNRCALLAHAREHKNNGVVMQCTQLFMKPIAEEQMFVPSSTESVGRDPYVSSSPSSKNQPVMPLYPDGLIRYQLRCLECNKQLPDYKALAGHYQRLSEDIEGLTCKVCAMLLPNKCSFKAHQRVHAHKSPYCCPECGALSRSADIQKHVKENCLHYARKAWYKCLHCDTVFKTLQTQKNHIEEKHCEVYYKCSVCPVAFKTSDSCESHLKNKHGANNTSHELIFKCSCETLFKKKPLLFQHFHQNANKRVTCVFKCPECNSVFPQKHLLMQHFKAVHTGDLRAEAEKNDAQTENPEWYQDALSIQQQKTSSPVHHTDVRKKAEQDSRPVKTTGWTCGDCLQWFPERDTYVSHVKTIHRRSVKRYPCRQCEQSFNSATRLRRHIRTDHSTNKIYTCWYCTDRKTAFAKSEMLKKHISLMHGIKSPDLRQMPKMPESNKTLGKGLLSESAVMRTQEEQEVCGHESPSAKRLKTQYRCSKCGFVTSDSAQFQQHIPKHKTDEGSPQCRHCGLSFTSAMALSRHLVIVHRVRDSDGEDEQATEVELKEQRNQAVGSAGTGEANDLLALTRTELSPTEEPVSLHCDKTNSCNIKLNSRSLAVSLK